MSNSKINGGYILQPRKIDDSYIMKQSPVVRELWSYIIRKVNWKDKDYSRGTGFFQFKDIQNDLCWYAGYRKIMYSKSQISKALRNLCESNAMETMKATRGVIITVLNYDYYQDKKNYEGNDENPTKEMVGQHYTKRKKKKEKSKEELLLEKTMIDNFNRFYKLYPKKVGKQPALKTWKKLNSSLPKISIIIRAIKKQKKTPQWQNKQFIPNPSNWLDDERWNDEIIEEQKPTKSKPKRTNDIPKKYRRGSEQYGQKTTTVNV